ncbi:transcriptional regulator [[Pantoea] beijingensis]|uniref:Transcriptional regulator n=1 Tax=[Pantoea] beijingensis TaxID=1324864 RepID=A0A443IBI2_9GAMM|nr:MULTISPECIES: IclR family transcriptional regulator [Erwiniaceae]RWR01256.1 transcriptional regulator [[Pantoea] beijingensis]
MSKNLPSRADEKAGGIQVIARAAKILNALGEKPYGMSLGEIAQAVDLPRSTVQRIVAALDSVQMIRTHGAGGVRLGPALLRLTSSVHADVVEIARPWLHALSAATNETVSLSRASGKQLAIVYYVVADRELRVVPRIGLNLPLYSTSGGRALLALENDDDIRILLGDAYATITEYTIKTLPELMARLNEVRKSGVSYDHSETLDGVSTMAVAMDTVLGRFSISLLMPNSRFQKHEARYRDEILKCKEIMLHELGRRAVRD